MRLTLVTAPVAEPLQLSEVKAHLPVEGTDDDTRITNLIVAARGYFERDTERQLITATWEGKLDSFPSSSRDAIRIPLPPLQSIASIKYLDSDGTLVTWPTTDYVVDAPAGPYARAGRVYLAYDKIWPITRDIRDAVRVQFVAGYGGASSVPNAVKEALLLLIAHWNEHREAVLTGATSKDLEFSLAPVLEQFKASSFLLA